jgi:hypothetical protein
MIKSLRVLAPLALLITVVALVTGGTASAHNVSVNAYCDGLKVSWSSFAEPKGVDVTIDGSTSSITVEDNGSEVFGWDETESHTYSVYSEYHGEVVGSGSQQACEQPTTTTTEPPPPTTTEPPPTTTTVPDAPHVNDVNVSSSCTQGVVVNLDLDDEAHFYLAIDDTEVFYFPIVGQQQVVHPLLPADLAHTYHVSVDFTDDAVEDVSFDGTLEACVEPPSEPPPPIVEQPPVVVVEQPPVVVVESPPVVVERRGLPETL